jgi:membrane protease YdiL (CAAX protease family)
MFTTLIAVIFTLILVVGVPALSYSTARNSEIQKLSRLDLYLSAVFSQWLLAVVGLGVVYVIARKVFVKGFAEMPLLPFLEWGIGIAGTALLALSIVIWCERHGWLPPESDLVYLLMPETAREKVWAVLILSPTAAFCEEFLFRGYLLTQFDDWLHSLIWAWIVSSVAFGLAHFYQGWSGMIRAGLLGALLAYPVVRWGTLYPAMLAHWLIDTVALLWLGSWMVERKSPESEVRGPES